MAVQDGRGAPPVDLRYLKLRRYDNTRSQDILQDVTSFLQKLYASVAETLPDVKDDCTLDDGVENEILGQDVSVEPYSDFKLVKAVKDDSGEKKSKPRKMRKSIKIQPGRSVADGNEERFLPPGSMREHYVQYKAQSGLEQPASFPAFWRVAWQTSS